MIDPTLLLVIVVILALAFDFSNGTLLLTEASQKKRAAIHLLRGMDAVADFDRGGLEPLEADLDQFRSRLLKQDWPRTIEELEARKPRPRPVVPAPGS